MSSTDRKLRVFLCHASQDKPIVRELYQRLLAEGWIDPWLDEQKLLPGQDWDVEIEKAAESSNAVIVCLSTTAITKEGYIQKEIKVALNLALYKPEGAIYIIPLRLDDCSVPWSIKSIQYIDYFPSSQTELAYSRILNSLETRAYGLGIKVTEIKEYLRQEADEKSKKELEDRIRKEAIEKIRREEEVAIRKRFEEQARKALEKKLRKQAEEKVIREKEKRDLQELNKKPRIMKKSLPLNKALVDKKIVQKATTKEVYRRHRLLE